MSRDGRIGSSTKKFPNRRKPTTFVQKNAISSVLIEILRELFSVVPFLTMSWLRVADAFLARLYIASSGQESIPWGSEVSKLSPRSRRLKTREYTGNENYNTVLKFWGFSGLLRLQETEILNLWPSKVHFRSRGWRPLNLLVMRISLDMIAVEAVFLAVLLTSIGRLYMTFPKLIWGTDISSIHLHMITVCIVKQNVLGYGLYIMVMLLLMITGGFEALPEDHTWRL